MRQTVTAKCCQFKVIPLFKMASRLQLQPSEIAAARSDGARETDDGNGKAPTWSLDSQGSVPGIELPLLSNQDTESVPTLQDCHEASLLQSVASAWEIDDTQQRAISSILLAKPKYPQWIMETWEDKP